MGKLWKDPPFLMGKLWKDPPFFMGTIFHGNIHYFDWAIFNSELLVYQRVCPEKNPISGTVIWDRFF